MRKIVSMTSYPGRINNVSKSIFFLLQKQTLPPDEIHLWLSVEEFKNKEKDLPKELVISIKHPKVFLHWLPKNTYVHKRHEYFKIAKDDDLVFLIDDDVRYDDRLIETVVENHKKFPNCIICYNYYSDHIYDGKRIKYNLSKLNPGPNVNKVRWCGQSMIPANIYPKECLSEENQKIRNNTSPISDECWFQPWIVYNDIPIYHCNFGWGDDIDKNNGKKKGIVSFSHKIEENGYTKRENWLYSVLTCYPKIMDKYKKEFNYGC